MLGFVRSIAVEDKLSYKMRFKIRMQEEYGTIWEQKTVFSQPSVFLEHHCYTHLGQRQNLRRRQALLKTLQEKGVSSVLFSQESTGVKLAELKQADASYLNAHIAGEVGAFVAEKAGDTVYCAFASLGHLEEQAVLTLASHYRYFMIEAGRDTAFLCRVLRQKYGLPIIEAPSQRQVKQAHFALLWKKPEMHFGENCLVYTPLMQKVNMGGRQITDFQLDMPEAYFSEVPKGFALHPVVSENLRRGTILAEKLKVKRILLDKLA